MVQRVAMRGVVRMADLAQCHRECTGRSARNEIVQTCQPGLIS